MSAPPEATSDSRLSAEFWPAAAPVFSCGSQQAAMHSGSPLRWSVIQAFDTVFGRFQGAVIARILFSDSPAASPRYRIDWLGRQNLFCGWKDIMPAARSKRCAYPASRRSVSRGTAPTRTAEKSWRPGRGRGSQATPFPRTFAPMFPDANQRSFRRRHLGHSSGLYHPGEYPDHGG